MSTIIKSIERAANLLREEKVVAIPTETVYGLSGNAESEKAIKKIFTLKNRPFSHPLIMHVAQGWDLREWVDFIPDYASELMTEFWPGPLTLVFKCKDQAVNPLVTGGQNTVAIRCPAHPTTQLLLNTLKFPLVAPSANPFGKISPTTAEHVQHSFPKKHLYILDGGRCEIGVESTIVSAVDLNNYQILRYGMINEKEIQKIAAPIVSGSSLPVPRVPGSTEHHYQPEKPLYCFTSFSELQEFCILHPNAYILSFTKDQNFKGYLGYQLPSTPDQLAYELYYQLRCADQSGAPFMAIELPPSQEIWLGITEKILKASTPLHI